MAEAEKILRTAPAAAPDRAGVFLARLTDRLRTVYVDARAIPACPKCGRPMARRSSAHGPFFGCMAYPACRGTRPMPQEAA